MAEAVDYQQTHSSLITRMDQVIALRPEWRFLEQQRHLKDVLRLLLRELQLHAERANKEAWSHNLQIQKALTFSWISLLLSQELQQPPQLTKENFIHVFYDCLCNDKHGSSGHQSVDGKQSAGRIKPKLASQFNMSGKKSDLKSKPFYAPYYHESQMLQQQVLNFVEAVYRLQVNHIGWEYPWYFIRPFLPFLSHHTPQLWLERFNELLLLLEQHDSLLQFSRTHQEFSKNHLHASHPLRRQASDQIDKNRQKYAFFYHHLNNNAHALSHALNLVAQKDAELYQFQTAISCLKETWEKAGLFRNTPTDNIELLMSLFSEAEYQRASIGESLKPQLHSLQQQMSSLKEKDAENLQIIIALFEVSNERAN